MAHAWIISNSPYIVGFNLTQAEEILLIHALNVVTSDNHGKSDPQLVQFERWFFEDGKGVSEQAIARINSLLKAVGKDKLMFHPFPSGSEHYMKRRGEEKCEERRVLRSRLKGIEVDLLLAEARDKHQCLNHDNPISEHDWEVQKDFFRSYYDRHGLKDFSHDNSLTDGERKRRMAALANATKQPASTANKHAHENTDLPPGMGEQPIVANDDALKYMHSDALANAQPFGPPTGEALAEIEAARQKRSSNAPSESAHGTKASKPGPAVDVLLRIEQILMTINASLGGIHNEIATLNQRMSSVEQSQAEIRHIAGYQK
ncbi:hypothetical protein [Thalassospira xiamenensis]|uniref:Uncharacterized protein n=1 Tax=Thalassospira xiamenensis TaxID=220697 RepID=A0A285TWF3_9PROT|nr:hypothetical protein [Thalassospira xiamenensis]SOC26626.1 hypothetical protein SAMN05428964_105148 [Thalassospira xiamenensis]